LSESGVARTARSNLSFKLLKLIGERLDFFRRGAEQLARCLACGELHLQLGSRADFLLQRALAIQQRGIDSLTNVRVSFGEHVQSFVLRTATGDTLRCSRDENADVFHAAIGGFGMLGCFSRVVPQTHRVHSGNLKVKALRAGNLRGMLDLMESRRITSLIVVDERGAVIGVVHLHDLWNTEMI